MFGTSAVPCPDTSGETLPGEDGMDLEKDHFYDETELSPLEEEELGGDTDEVVETEEVDLIIADEGDDEEGATAAKPAAKAAPKKSASAKPAKSASSKLKPKKALKKKAEKGKAKKAARKPAKKKKRR